MKTSDTQPPNLSPQLYHQLIYTLTALLPPPIDDSPAALHARNQAAIAKAAAMLPVNADEADLAAQCVGARGQAEDVLRLIRENAGDLPLTIRLNAQYASMMRTSVSVRGLLMRVQAVRRKREAIESAATQDAWILHIAEQSMRKAVDRNTDGVTASPEAARGEAPEAARGEAPEAARGEAPRAAPEEAPKVAPAAAPAPPGDQRIAESVSENNTKSHDAAFGTWVRERPWNRPGETDLRKRVREAMNAGLRLAWQELSADGRASPNG